MVDEPEIIKKLKEEEKLGKLGNSLQVSHEGLEVPEELPEESFEDVPDKGITIMDDAEKDDFYKEPTQNGNLSSNESVEGILGYRPEELIGMNSMGLISKECQDGTETNFNNLPKTGEIPSETVLLDKKGQPHFVEYSFTVIKESSVLKHS